MKIQSYDIDLEKAVKTIKEKNYKNIVLQIPDGLRIHTNKFVEFIEKETNASVLISGEPCFGACDILDDELNDFDVDFVIQIGHTPLPCIKDYKIPVLFVNALVDFDVLKSVEKIIPSIKGKKIGLVTTAQHVHMLEKVEEILCKQKFEPVIGAGDNRISYRGQILGCNFSAATSIMNKVDMFLFIGSGSFHPLGLILRTRKPVVAYDPYTNEVKAKELDDFKDIILKQRYGAITRSSDAKVFGILVGAKKGQQRIDLAYKIKQVLDSKHKKSYIIILNHFSSSFLESFRDVGCFISTACPRLAIDDYLQYKVPIITPFEFEILFGIKKWDDYKFDEILS